MKKAHALVLIYTIGAAGLLAAALAPSRAHPPSITMTAGEQAVVEEIKAFRQSIVDAIAAKDATKLRDMYATSFVHTHTTGKTDSRDARIVAALAGDPIIETAPAEELVIRIPNDWVAIASGTSPIKSMTDSKINSVKWMAVYARAGQGWVLVASQATRVAEVKP